MRLAALAALMLLTACGGSDQADRDGGGALSGVRGFLGNAFTGSDDAAGGLCGDARLVGEPIGRVTGKLPGCGIADAVRITAVNGVTLSQASVVDCQTARRFADWVEDAAKPAIGRKGGGLEQIRIAAHYACRTRNHRPGAPISEHGKGKAIDVSALTLADGRTLTVEDDWRGSGRYSRALRRMHRNACGTFGTTLGPGSDGFHEDHFHYDTAAHRGGSYCR